jgi:hypothetical protein
MKVEIGTVAAQFLYGNICFQFSVLVPFALQVNPSGYVTKGRGKNRFVYHLAPDFDGFWLFTACGVVVAFGSRCILLKNFQVL